MPGDIPGIGNPIGGVAFAAAAPPLLTCSKYYWLCICMYFALTNWQNWSSWGRSFSSPSYSRYCSGLKVPPLLLLVDVAPWFSSLICAICVSKPDFSWFDWSSCSWSVYVLSWSSRSSSNYFLVESLKSLSYWSFWEICNFKILLSFLKLSASFFISLILT